MTSYVVDASVVMSHLVATTYTLNAQSFFRQLASSDEVIVPEFCLVECANVLWKRMTFEGMPQSDAKLLLYALKKMPLERVPVKRMLDAALLSSMRLNVPIYDAIYIALAQHRNCGFLTIDTKQRAAAQAEGVTLIPITRFHP